MGADDWGYWHLVRPRPTGAVLAGAKPLHPDHVEQGTIQSMVRKSRVYQPFSA
jgi:hypothetical protein